MWPEAYPLRPEPEGIAMTDATDDLFRAARSGTACDVRAALSAGADLNARTKGGKTPLHLAVEKGNEPSVIDALLGR